MQSGVNNGVNIINILLQSYAQYCTTKNVKVLILKDYKAYECKGMFK